MMVWNRTRGRYEQEESIYNLVKPNPYIEPKPPRHQSMYPHDTPPTASTFGAAAASQIMTCNLGGSYSELARNHRHIKQAATFGPKNEHYSDPTSYLAKGNKPPLPEPKRFTYRDGMKKKEGPPKLGGTLPKLDVTANSKKKNYIQLNAIAAITQKPGNRGKEEIRFMERPGYGKVPDYLDKVKREIVAEKEYIKNELEKRREQNDSSYGGMTQTRLLKDDERENLLDNLKAKWEVVNKAYQGMTHITVMDTMGKIRRKEDYENQLQQLEKAIEKMSKQYVFVEGN